MTRVEDKEYDWKAVYDPLGRRLQTTCTTAEGECVQITSYYDPVSYPSCLDLYAYANGDPINYRDLDGRFASYAYKQVGTVIIDMFHSHQFQGGIRTNYA